MDRKAYSDRYYELNKDKQALVRNRRKTENPAEYQRRLSLVRDRNREKVTGFSKKLVAELREVQNGACAICTRKMRTDNCRAMDGEHTDHDHKTGMTRALLCRTCNMSLGFYEKWQRPAGLRIAPYEDYLDSFVEIDPSMERD